MSYISLAFRFVQSAIVSAAFVSIIASPALAQDRKSVEREAVQAQQAVTQRTTLKAVSAEDQLRAAIERCGAPCSMGSTGSVAVPGSGSLDYNCNDDGDCSCFGAKDCVAMSDICKEGTMGCNKQGCVCEEDSGG